MVIITYSISISVCLGSLIALLELPSSMWKIFLTLAGMSGSVSVLAAFLMESALGTNLQLAILYAIIGGFFLAFAVLVSKLPKAWKGWIALVIIGVTCVVVLFMLLNR